MHHSPPIAFLVGLLCSACAGSLPKALDKVEVGMVAVDVVVDKEAEMWTRYVDGRIAECQAKEPLRPEERDACLGPAVHSPKVEAYLEALVAGQEAMSAMLKVVRDLDADIRPALEAARKASKQ